MLYNVKHYIDISQVEELKVNPESKFKEDLDLDSLDAVEVSFFFFPQS